VGFINGRMKFENLYSYQLLTPPETSRDEVTHMMQEDLRRFFKLKGEMSKRTMKCLVLKADDTTLIQSKGGVSETTVWNYGIEIKNDDFTRLWIELQHSMYYYFPYPIIDETNFHGKADIDLEVDVEDHDKLDQALSKYKMHFQLEDREVDVLIISEVDKEDGVSSR
jgi:uncharacterized protein (TIGR03435 family)